MKYLIIIPTLLTLFSCTQEKNISNQNMVQIKKETKNLKLRVGEEVFYEGRVHGSVGIGVKVEIENSEIIERNKTKVKYHNEDRKNKPGSDSATKTFTFKALKTGQTKITIKHIFRGTLKSEQLISCNVTE